MKAFKTLYLGEAARALGDMDKAVRLKEVAKTDWQKRNSRPGTAWATLFAAEARLERN